MLGLQKENTDRVKATYGLIESLRPKQWTKNLLIFAGLIFSSTLFVPENLFKAVYGFLIFSIVSGVTYIINDLRDIEEDKRHPKKKLRPLASGRLPKEVATVWAFALLLGSLSMAYFMDMQFFLITILYFILMVFYSLYLKKIVILDVLVIALGFVLRAVAGAVIIGVSISPWLVLCTLLLALFLALCKRRHELVLLENTATLHRKVLKDYSINYLDQLISIVTTGTIVVYALYTMNSGKPKMMVLTMPLVIYGIFRYLYLVHQKKQGGSPEELLVTDKPLLITILLWGVATIACFYFI
ncbi:decaprenyl-phosphate phosphoribosyltransferase [Clostridia bacterium]|nr:decaprenyl-phosphate phosphoribosyltransferase [Clostridia bacterium]